MGLAPRCRPVSFGTDRGQIEGRSGNALTDYVGTVTCYLDGVAIFKLTSAENDKGMEEWQTLLFKAQRTGDQITYSDVSEGFIIPFQINNTSVQTGKTVYVAIADVYVTCGTSFVQEVERVDNPEEATFEVEDGVEIPAKMWFTLVD